MVTARPGQGDVQEEAEMNYHLQSASASTIPNVAVVPKLCHRTAANAVHVSANAAAYPIR